MSNSYFCEACEVRVEPDNWKDGDDRYNYTSRMRGPFCDKCFFFVKELEALHDRIILLENA